MNLQSCSLLIAVGILSTVTIGQAKFATCPKDESKCRLPECLCGSTEPPAGLAKSEIPQIVLLTFDDAVNAINFEFYNTLIKKKRLNPNGCPIGMTFYVSHEYTNYAQLHSLWARGHEIALHSITHKDDMDYWADGTLQQWKEEFVDERIILKEHGLIPENESIGLRVPFLQLGGDVQFEMMSQNGFEYEASQPSIEFIDEPLWPYTLDYKPIQDCVIDPCPTRPFPGTWVVPMVDWYDSEGNPCSMSDACAADDRDDVDDMLMSNFLRHYNTTKAPFGIFTHAAWFVAKPYAFDAYVDFVDTILENYPDVYFVTTRQAVNWMRQPTKLEDLKDFEPWDCAETRSRNNSCTEQTCHYETSDNDEQEYWFTTCAAECPATYPWIGNPRGSIRNP